jgi:hypothetical protein
MLERGQVHEIVHFPIVFSLGPNIEATHCEKLFLRQTQMLERGQVHEIVHFPIVFSLGPDIL